MTGKPHDSMSKGLVENAAVGAGFAAYLGGVDGETAPNDAVSEFNYCACAALWLESSLEDGLTRTENCKDARTEARSLGWERQFCVT